MTKPLSKQAELVQKSLKKRYAAEKRFKAFGMASISFGLAALLVLFIEIFGGGMGGFRQTQIELTITFDADELEGLGPLETRPAVARRAVNRRA